MPRTLLIVACLAVGQLASAERLPYMFGMKNGDVGVIYAFVNSSDDVLVQLERSLRIEVELAAPWLPEQNRRKTIYLRDLSDPTQIARADTIVFARYIREGWEANGGVQVETASGEMQWVHGKEAELHERSLAMQAEAFPPPKALEAPPSEPGETTGPSFIEEWGMHLAVGGGGLVLMALTAWWAFLRQP